MEIIISANEKILNTMKELSKDDAKYMTDKEYIELIYKTVQVDKNHEQKI